MTSRASILLLLTAFYLQVNQGLCQKRSDPRSFVYSHIFTTEQGLSQNNVSCIAKDLNGFIWVGTGDGLNRFDGYSFIRFNHSDRNASSLSNDVIRNLLLDSKGRLWIGTYNGLNLYDTDREIFKKFLMNPSRQDAISHNTILCLLEDRNQNLWVGTYWGLNKIDLKTLKVTSYFSTADGKGLADNAVNALLEDREGKIWACTGKGINIMNASGVEKTIPQSDVSGGLISRVIVDIIQDSKGAIYIATNGGGLLKLDNENDATFENFKYTSGKALVSHNIISSLRIDRKGRMIIGTDGAGLYRQEGNARFSWMVDRKKKVLENASVQEIFVDDQNNYWVGIFGAGLAFIPGESPRFEHYQFFDSTMERLTKNSVLAIVEDHNQKIWIGTDGSGLYQFDPETKQFVSFLHSPTNKNSLSTNVVRSLMIDDRNNLYIGTYAGGLNHLDTRTMTFSRYLHNTKAPTSISTNHVWSLLQDSNKRIFIGQLGGLDEFMPESSTFRALTIAGQNPVTTNTASVFSMQEDRQGKIWMGTRLAGVHRYDPLARTFKSFIHISGDSLSFPTNEILELALDRDGKILVGTDNKGLIRIDPDSFTFSLLAPDYREENIPSILDDNYGNLWFTSFNGLHRYNPNSGEILDYTIADGLQGIHFNEGARLKSSSGAFYLGGTNGLNIFYPEKMIQDDSKPNVIFTKLSLYHDIVRINDKSKLLTESIAKTKVITFKPDQNVFSIEFACLEYKFPKTNRYRYLLEEFDNNWNDIKENRTATYTSLPPGEYTLKVSATNGHGHWNEEAASIRIIVLPRWHQRLSVRIAFVVLLIAGTLGFVHARTNFLVNQKRKLEHLVAVRTQLVETQKEEIKDKNEKLEHAYEELHTVNEQLQRVNTGLEKVVETRTEELRHTIKKLIETDKGLNTFLYRSSHDLRGPITSLLGLAQIAKMQNEQDQLVPHFSNIENTAVSMLRLLKRLTETAALFRATRQEEIIRTEEFIQSIMDQMRTVACHSSVKLEIVNKIGESFICDPHLLNHIVVNLMENSIIYRGSDNPFARCVLSMEQRVITIQVTDNGTGISPDLKNKIFEMFYRGSERSVGNGLGLFMVTKALEILNGSIALESEPNVLTTFTVSIPDLNPGV